VKCIKRRIASSGILVEVNMPQTVMVTSEQLRKLVQRIIEVENARPGRTVEETVADIGKLIAIDAEGWINGQRIESVAAERELERILYGVIDDYHRDIERMVVDPPFVSFSWIMKSVKHGLESTGCSIIEANDAGQILRSWMFFDPAPFKAMGIQV
jgi:hypothetical protein